MFNVTYANARGITGKMKSLHGVIEQLEPEVMAITETNLNTDKNIIVEGYSWLGRPRQNKEGGGIGLLVKNTVKPNTTIHKIGKDDKEIMWIRIKTKKHEEIAIGVYYGKQETRNTREQIVNEFQVISNMISELTLQKVQVLLIGDFNAKIFDQESRNGRIMRKELIEQNDLKLLNETEKCRGKYTE